MVIVGGLEALVAIASVVRQSGVLTHSQYGCGAATASSRPPNPVRPHMARLIVFKRLIYPSTGPVLQDNDNAARTAARSRTSPPANPARADPFAASSHPSSRSACWRRTMLLNSRATLMTPSSSGERAIRASANCCSVAFLRFGSATTSHAARSFESTGRAAASRSAPDAAGSAPRRALA